MKPALLTVAQVAEFLNVKPATIYEWARMGYIPSVQLGTGKKKPCVRFDHDEIEQWLAARKKSGRSTRVPTLLK